MVEQVITVDGVTLKLPCFSRSKMRGLRPRFFRSTIVHANPKLPIRYLTRDVLTKCYEQIIDYTNNTILTGGEVRFEVGAINRMIYLWNNNAYWDHEHALDIGIAHPPENRVLLDKLQVDKEIYRLPVIETTNLGGLRPAELLQRLKDENIPVPSHYFTKDVIIRCYGYLIKKAHPDALVPGTQGALLYTDWLRSWRRDDYWNHQHQLDTNLGLSQSAQVGNTIGSSIHEATTTIASEIDSDDSDDSDDKMEDSLSDSESDSDGSSDDSGSHHAQVVSSVVQEEPRLQSSSPSPSSLDLSLSPEIPESSTAAILSMRVQRASPAVPRAPSPLTDVVSHPVVVQPAVLPEPASLPTVQVASPTEHSQAAADPPTAVAQHQQARTARIGNHVYRLPDAGKFVLQKISLKFFSLHFLKTNRRRDVPLIKADVLAEAYRIFIVRCFPDVPAAEQNEFLARGTSYFAMQYLEEHTEWVRHILSLQVPEILTPAASVPPPPSVKEPTARVVAALTPPANAPSTPNSSDVEITEVRPRRPSAAARDRLKHQLRSTVAADATVASHLHTKPESPVVGSGSLTLQSTAAQVIPSRTQLLVDNMLYTMPMTSELPLEGLTVMSFSRAIYQLNAQYPARDLSQPLILKAYKSYIFNQYPNASFEAKISACQKLDWPTPPVAAKEYLRNLEILERTQKKIGVVPAALPPVRIADTGSRIMVESKRARRREEEEKSLFVTPSPELRRSKPSKRRAEAPLSDEDDETPLVRTRKQTTEGEKRKKRRTTEASDAGAGGHMFMAGGLAFRPSPAPAALSADIADASPHKRKKKAHKNTEERS